MAALDEAQTLFGGVATLSTVVLPAAVAWLIPKDKAWQTRLPLALIAGLLALFISHLWVSAGDEVETALAPFESPHLLSWLIGLPLLGAIGILFLPRQAPRVLT